MIKAKTKIKSDKEMDWWKKFRKLDRKCKCYIRANKKVRKIHSILSGVAYDMIRSYRRNRNGGMPVVNAPGKNPFGKLHQK